MKYMKKVLAVLFVMLPIMAFAQNVTVNASMMAMAQAELQKRGLNEAEVRTRLMEEGIDVDNIPPTEYANYQGRVMDILNQMQAEKDSAETTQSTSAVPASTTTPYAPITTASEAVAETQTVTDTENETATVDSLEIYGHSLFTGKSLEVFRTTDGAMAPDTYVLGEGDEVHISIFGSSQTEIHQRIAADGSIQPAGSSKIFLKGMTIGQARKAIQSKLASHYSFREDQIAVTITTARTIQV